MNRIPTVSRARRLAAGILLAAGLATGGIAVGLEQSAASDQAVVASTSASDTVPSRRYASDRRRDEDGKEPTP